MIVTQAKIAEAIDVSMSAFLNGPPTSPDQKTGAFLMISCLLQVMGLKTAEESIAIALQRMKAKGNTFDLLNQEHRAVLQQICFQMFEPLAIQELMFVGISSDKKVFIAHMSTVVEHREIEEIKGLLMMAATAENHEEFNI